MRLASTFPILLALLGAFALANAPLDPIAQIRNSGYGPGRAGPGRAGPGRAGPGRAGPGRAGPGRAGPGRAGPGGSQWRPRPLPDRSEFPTWDIDRKYANDVFTFVRIRYDSFGPFGWWDRWDNDYPDGDWNFSYRLQQLTSLKVNPNSEVFRLTDEQLLDHPFAYMAGAQRMMLSEEEVVGLRRYLSNGGFLMVDDLWTPEGWRQVRNELGRVLPKCEPQELTLEHPIFHMVYDLKELPQVVDLRTWQNGDKYEYMHGPTGGDSDPHFWAFADRDGRMVALVCHNNDLGDGWEREGENREYFEQFSERFSYPMGVNIITYAMSH